MSSGPKFYTLAVDDARWQTLLNRSYISDFYHTACYHQLEQDQGEPILLVAESASELLLLPLLVRPVFETNFYDATSVYGYAGPVGNKPLDDVDAEFLDFFRQQADNFFKQKNIISVFSRLHPLIDAANVLLNWGKVKSLNKTVFVDLQEDLTQQRANYRNSYKTQINGLVKKKGYCCEILETSEQLDRFVEIYHQTMNKVDASDYYYFDKPYFEKLLNNDCFESFVLLAYKDGDITAGAVYTISNGIMQYHLSGTSPEFLKDMPMKLIMDRARLMANEKALRFFHMGGGVGGSDDDSLFHFKAGFSKDYAQFSVWNYIVDPKAYEALLHERGIENDPSDNFFPLYRKAKTCKAS